MNKTIKKSEPMHLLVGAIQHLLAGAIQHLLAGAIQHLLQAVGFEPTHH